MCVSSSGQPSLIKASALCWYDNKLKSYWRHMPSALVMAYVNNQQRCLCNTHGAWQVPFPK